MLLKVRRAFGAYVGGGVLASPQADPASVSRRVGDAPPYINGISLYPAERPEAFPYICAFGVYTTLLPLFSPLLRA